MQNDKDRNNIVTLSLLPLLLSFFFFFFLIGSCPVYLYPDTCTLSCPLVMLMFNFRINVLEAVQVAWEYLVPYFVRFLQVIIHPV